MKQKIIVIEFIEFLEQQPVLCSSDISNRITICLIDNAICLDVKGFWVSSSAGDLLCFPRLT